MSLFRTQSPIEGAAGSSRGVLDRVECSKPSERTATVFVVNEDQATRESLSATITQEGWRPRIFALAEEFLAHPIELAPGCLILDVSLPDLSGLELQRRAAVKCPHIPTVFLSVNSDIPTTVEAMKAGAIEFLSSPYEEYKLVNAIRESLERSQLVIARRSEAQALQERYASLSLRQRQVMVLVASGLLNKEVASELGISEITVKAHRGQVMQKMRASSLPHLVTMASRLRIVRHSTWMQPRPIKVDPVVNRAFTPGTELATPA